MEKILDWGFLAGDLDDAIDSVPMKVFLLSLRHIMLGLPVNDRDIQFSKDEDPQWFFYSSPGVKYMIGSVQSTIRDFMNNCKVVGNVVQPLLHLWLTHVTGWTGVSE
jgi:hypothetical protein